MEIKIYKRALKNIFHNYCLWAADPENNDYSVSDYCRDIANDFKNKEKIVTDEIKNDIGRMTQKLFINVEGCWVFTKIVRDELLNHMKKIEQELFENWEKLEELQIHKKEIEYLCDPKNVEKFLEPDIKMHQMGKNVLKKVEDYAKKSQGLPDDYVFYNKIIKKEKIEEQITPEDVAEILKNDDLARD